MTEQAYNSEALLQKLLVDYPSLLAGDQIDSTTPRRWLLIKPEMEVPSEEDGYRRWFVDHLFLDQDGIPTIVEVKRSCDTRIRREVVGQMLDYASHAVVYWSIEKIIAQFEANCQIRGLEPNTLLSHFLVLDRPTLFDLIEDDIQISSFWQRVKNNLQIGKIRLLFVADKIPSELQRIIEFLNKQMNPVEVIGVEIKKFEGQNLKVLIPRVIGQTTAVKGKKISSFAREVRQWNETNFIEEIEIKQGVDIAKTTQTILDWASCKNLSHTWGQGNQSGSFTPRIVTPKGEKKKFFVVWTSGTVEISANEAPFNLPETKNELLNRLTSIVGKALSVNPYYWYIPLSVLTEESILKQFLEVIEWAIGEIQLL
ncbi:hypothetical protein [Chroococcidiopsis sp [FACHB-1243]]|uniref:hypothetical protein n=1 Tax=Chroococcidiopsis sp. [FACHB-1243] TaxID=2692781 RepID=UPI0018EFE916|nr:hypothetical protein [Chroococcidiopsis sp. [FACHB-1243]]